MTPVTRHLTRSDYINMPWANGRGTTVEILREPNPDLGFLWRFSMATVTEDGAFSVLPGVERNLTIIDGPGFDLVGDKTAYRADPLRPIAFAGDVALAARNVKGPAIDFNVMTQRHLRKPYVSVETTTHLSARPGAILCLFALGPTQFGPYSLSEYDFLVDANPAKLDGAAVLAIQLFVT